MKILCAVLSALLVMATGCIIYLYQGTHNRIALLDMDRIITESAPGKAGQAHLAQVDQRFRKGMDELSATFNNAPEEEKQRVFRHAEDTLVRQFSMEERDVSEAIKKVIYEEAEKWRQKNRVSVIFPAQLTLAHNDARLDATDDILQAVNQRHITFAELPELKIAPPTATKQPTSSGKNSPATR